MYKYATNEYSYNVLKLSILQHQIQKWLNIFTSISAFRAKVIHIYISKPHYNTLEPSFYSILLTSLLYSLYGYMNLHLQIWNAQNSLFIHRIYKSTFIKPNQQNT